MKRTRQDRDKSSYWKAQGDRWHLHFMAYALSHLPSKARRPADHQRLYQHLRTLAVKHTQVNVAPAKCDIMDVCVFDASDLNIQELRLQGFAVRTVECHPNSICVYTLDWSNAKHGLALELRALFEQSAQYQKNAHENLASIVRTIGHRAAVCDREPFAQHVVNAQALEWVKELVRDHPCVELVNVELDHVTLRLDVDREFQALLPHELPRELQTLVLDFVFS